MRFKEKIYLAILLPSLLFGSESSTFPTLEDEYTPRYCMQLEAAYGEGLMSEGGKEGIELMFSDIPLENKVALDIGSGVGGVAFYLANQYHMQITGIEVNAWMVAEAQRRIPSSLKEKVDFLLTSGNSHWPLPSESYHLIYSKECHRLLQKKGLFVITDWLSSDKKEWGENIKQLVELEHLALYPETKEGYKELLQRNGFTVLSIRDDSSVYFHYNRSIIENLNDPDNRPFLLHYFTEAELQSAVIGYESIAKALADKELRVFRFVAQKE
jgi:SAM-dependent methyltransferase